MSAVPRPGSVPGQKLHLELLSVPKEGGITVRFLARPLGVLTHSTRQGQVACTGLKTCATAFHAGRTTWKGYAAVDLWRDPPLSDWLPAVLEVTERLAELLGEDNLRGQVWYLCRQIGRHKHPECTGHLVDQVAVSSLAEAFDVRGVVQRVYREPRVWFGAELLLPARVQVEAQKDGYIPPTAAAPPVPAEQSAAEAAAERAKVRELVKKLKGGAK